MITDETSKRDIWRHSAMDLEHPVNHLRVAMENGYYDSVTGLPFLATDDWSLFEHSRLFHWLPSNIEMDWYEVARGLRLNKTRRGSELDQRGRFEHPLFEGRLDTAYEAIRGLPSVYYNKDSEFDLNEHRLVMDPSDFSVLVDDGNGVSRNSVVVYPIDTGLMRESGLLFNHTGLVISERDVDSHFQREIKHGAFSVEGRIFHVGIVSPVAIGLVKRRDNSLTPVFDMNSRLLKGEEIPARRDFSNAPVKRIFYLGAFDFDKIEDQLGREIRTNSVMDGDITISKIVEPMMESFHRKIAIMFDWGMQELAEREAMKAKRGEGKRQR